MHLWSCRHLGFLAINRSGRNRAALLRVESFQDFHQSRDERRQILHDDLPKYLLINCVVAVDEAVAQPDDLRPWD